MNEKQLKAIEERHSNASKKTMWLDFTGGPVAFLGLKYLFIDCDNIYNNALFACKAVEDIPALIKALRESQAESAKLKEDNVDFKAENEIWHKEVAKYETQLLKMQEKIDILEESVCRMEKQR